MKVAYLINQYPQLSHSFIRREIKALEGRGLDIFRVSVRSVVPGPDPADRAEAAITWVLLACPKWRLLANFLWVLMTRPILGLLAIGAAARMGWRSGRGMWRHGFYLVEACALLVRMRRENVQHLHAHFGTNSAAVAVLARQLGGPPFSFTVHGPEEFDHPESLALAFKIHHAAFVVAVSSFGRSQLYRWTPPDQWAKLHVVRCGVDSSFAAEKTTSVPDVPRLACVGRLCEQKGQLLLLRALKMLLDDAVDCELDLIGDGPLGGTLQREVQRLGLMANVRMLGPQPSASVRQHLQAARGMVLPSFAEGLPVVLMEALSLGRPVVTTFVAGIPELVVDGESGWLVPAGSVELLARAMRAMLETPVPQLTAMGKSGASRVARMHDVVHEAGVLDELFQGIPPATDLAADRQLIESVPAGGVQRHECRGSFNPEPAATVRPTVAAGSGLNESL